MGIKIVKHFFDLVATFTCTKGYVYINQGAFENGVFILKRSPSTLVSSKSLSSTLKLQKT